MYFNELIFEFSHQNSTINMTIQVLEMLPFLARKFKYRKLPIQGQGVYKDFEVCGGCVN